MKQCPKCQVTISDTAKFCVKCGCNIKKYEEERVQSFFCPSCGTSFSGGFFCPECGFNVNDELNAQESPATTDTFGDDWLSDLASDTSADLEAKRAEEARRLLEQALSAFEYETHADGTYTITGLRDRNAMQYTVPRGVVTIADSAFEGSEAIAITLPDGLIKIGSRAFKKCINLTSIGLPQSLMLVGDEAFAECELLDLEIPSTVRRVGADVIHNTARDKRQKAEAEAAAEKRRAEKAEAKRRAEATARLAKWEVGKTVTFGSYPQRCNNAEEEQPIEWIVLAREDNKALLLSKYLLEAMHYDANATWENFRTYVTTWSSCSIRAWLNDHFFSHFDGQEKRKILRTHISTPNNPEDGTDCGADTDDRIFLLSMQEVEQYLSPNDRIASVTEFYAESRGYGIDEAGHASWWLRTVEENQTMASTVDYEGDLVPIGFVDDHFIRPALWLNIESFL